MRLRPPDLLLAGLSKLYVVFFFLRILSRFLSGPGIIPAFFRFWPPDEFTSLRPSVFRSLYPGVRCLDSLSSPLVLGELIIRCFLMCFFSLRVTTSSTKGDTLSAISRPSSQPSLVPDFLH